MDFLMNLEFIESILFTFSVSTASAVEIVRCQEEQNQSHDEEGLKLTSTSTLRLDHTAEQLQCLSKKNYNSIKNSHKRNWVNFIHFKSWSKISISIIILFKTKASQKYYTNVPNSEETSNEWSGADSSIDETQFVMQLSQTTEHRM